uniref:Uncharacterized protein n=1 Tax=Arundo donax TaxID=35708 RepID=A0A0A9EUG2_ARUDO
MTSSIARHRQHQQQSFHLLQSFVPMTAQDDSVMATVVHFIVVVLAPKLLAEHQGNIVVGRCLKGDAATARLPEAKLLTPSAFKGGNCQRSLRLLY